MKQIGDEAKALEKLSIRFNIDPTQFSSLQYAAKKAGMEIELFNRGVQFMAKNISNAAIGIEEMVVTEDGLLEMSGKAGQAIQELGLNLNLLSRLPIDVQLKPSLCDWGKWKTNQEGSPSPWIFSARAGAGSPPWEQKVWARDCQHGKSQDHRQSLHPGTNATGIGKQKGHF